jgi:replicative DNA helicase
MANLELQIISNIIKSGDLREIKKRGITSRLFQTEEGKEMFRWVMDQYNSPSSGNEVPSLDRVHRHFPEFDFCPSRDSIPVLLGELIGNNVAQGIREITQEMDDLIQDGEDPQEVLQTFLPELRDLNIQGGMSEHLLLSGAVDILRDDYETMQNAGGITGVPWPWAPLNKATAGMQDEDFIVIYGRPKNMKCVVAGQKIMTRTGELVAIEDLPEECEVPSYTEATGKLRWAKARRVYSGEKMCVRVVTDSGYTVETGDKHYFMVPEGSFEGSFERICDLGVGDWVATTRSTPDWEPTRTSASGLGWMLGALVGDGNYTRNEVQFANWDPEVVDRMAEEASRFECKMKDGFRPGEYRIVAPGRPGNPLLDFLREEGMHGKKAEDKSVPDLVFEADRETIGAFLAGLLDTDGTVWPERPYSLAWSTASKELAYGLKHLLARFGIVASPYWSPNEGQGQWLVTVYGLEQHKKAAQLLSPHITCIRKAQALEELTKDRFTKKNTDGVPYSDGLMALILQEKGSNAWPKMGQSSLDRGKLFRRSEKISRALLKSLADAWDSEPLRIVAEQDVLWDRIKEITPIGKHDCYDICIEDGQDPNFVVEGFAVHNTWIACSIAAHAYAECNKRVLVYSKEMSDKIMARRVASIVAEVDYDRLKRGDLPPDEAEFVWDTLMELEDWEKGGRRRASMSFLSDRKLRGRSGATVDVIAAEAEKFEADLIIVDGFYLMRDGRTGVKSRDWKQIANISSDLKDMAQQLQVPVLGTTQANRGAVGSRGEDLAELGFADAIGQDADLVMRVFKGKNQATGKPKIMLTFPGVRDAILNPFVVNAWPGCDFTLLQSSVDVDSFLEDKKRSDEEEEEKAGGGSTAKKATKRRRRKKATERF